MIHRLCPVLLAACSIALTGSVGCDTASNAADRELSRQISANTSPNGAESHKALEAASKDASTSAGNRALAKGILAGIEFEAAAEKSRDVERAELDLSALIATVGDRVTQASFSGRLAQGYSNYDPKPAKDHLQKLIAEAQGGPGKAAWITHGQTTLPTVATALQEISRLEGDIAKREEEKRQLSEQRGAVLAEADAASRSADSAEGQKAVDEFKRASDLRRKASDLGTQIQQVEASILAPAGELAVAQAQLAAVQNAVKQFQDQVAALDGAWAQVQQRAEEQRKVAEAIVKGDNEVTRRLIPTTQPLEGVSIESLLERIDETSKRIAQDRAQAVDGFERAFKTYSEAASDASAFRIEVDQAATKDPSREQDPAYRAMREAAKNSVNDQYYKLQAANVQRHLASLHMAAAMSADNRLHTAKFAQTALTSSGVPSPATLSPGTLEADKGQALAKAEEAYKTAEDLIESVVSGASPTQVRNAGLVAKALVLYGQHQMFAIKGDEKRSAEKLDLSKAAAQSARDAGLTMPLMPGPLRAPAAPANPTTEPSVSETPATPAGSGGGDMNK